MFRTQARTLRAPVLAAAAIAIAVGGACQPKAASTHPVDATASATETPALPSETSPAPQPPKIDSARMLSLLATLSSDEFGGRYTLSDDIVRAADWVGEQYKASGVLPVGDSYAAPFSLVTGVRTTSPATLQILSSDGRTVDGKPGTFVAVPTSGTGTVEAEAVFVGYAALGTDASGEVIYDDLAGLDLDGKIAVVLTGRPKKGSKGTAAPRFPRRGGRLGVKVERLVDAGVAGVIAVKGKHSFATGADRKAAKLPSGEHPGPRPLRATQQIPIVQMQWREADRLLGGAKPISKRQRAIDTSQAPQSGSLELTAVVTTAKERDTADIPNVLGTIPGTDLANEIVLIGAHYDHIGRDEGGPGHCVATGKGDTRDDICNGADDNGSGSVIVVEIARAIAESGLKPRRTLVFALFAGEEIGLLGSKAMAKNLPTAPPFDAGTIVAMINIDMVGRLRPDRGLAVGGVGSSQGWMPLLDGVDTRSMPILFDRATTTRSDHASFYRLGIPTLFFFTFTHGDYHGPGDEFEGINPEGLTHVAEYVLDATLSAADGHALPFSTAPKAGEGLVGALPGDNEATIEKRVGFSEPTVEPKP